MYLASSYYNIEDGLLLCCISSSSAISAATLPTGSSPGDTTVGSPRATTEVTDGHQEDEQEDEQEESPPGATISNCSMHAYNNIIFI